MGVGDRWLWNHRTPSPLLLPGVQATLGGSPDLPVLRGFWSGLCVLTPGLLQECLPNRTIHRATWHPYLRNGSHGEGAHLSAVSPGSPPQEAVPSSDFSTLICTLNFNEICNTSLPVRPGHRHTWIPTRTGPEGSS